MRTATHTLQNLLQGFATAVPPISVRGLQLDSRKVQSGDVFLACQGHGQHGLRYLDQALHNGAAAIVWEPTVGVVPPTTAVPAIAVSELSRKVGAIAARFYGEPTHSLTTTGITGTDGKTSTAWLLAQALEVLGQPCAYLGTLGYGRIGALDAATHTTPDALSLQRHFAEYRDQGVHAAAMEVSSHALDQDRVAGIHFHTVILTNLTRDHLDYHGTVERYAAAKRRLFERPEPTARIFNRDDAQGAQWARAFERVTVYGLDGEVPQTSRYVLGRQLELHRDGIRFDVDSSWGVGRLESRLLGRFNAYNLLAVLAALLHRDIALPDALNALAQVRTVPGRIEAYRGTVAAPLVVVDYAHTPQALEQILQAVRAHTAGKLWCVFGCGGDRDRGKRPLMGAAAEAYADEIVITDDNPRSERPEAIVAEILGGVKNAARVRVLHDRAEAIRTTIALAAANDAVVVAGKGHEETQTYGGDVRRFSDREFVARQVNG